MAKTKTRARTSAVKKTNGVSARVPLGPNNRRALGFIAALAFCGFTMLALASYVPTDPAFSRRSSVEAIANWCGRLGALESDVLLQLFGWGSWVVLPLSVWLVMRFARRDEATVGKLAALAFGMWWSSTLLGLAFYPDTLSAYPHGGVLGASTAAWLLANVGAVGSYVMVGVLLVGACTVLFNIHWERLAGRGVVAVENHGPVVQGACRAARCASGARPASALPPGVRRGRPVRRPALPRWRRRSTRSTRSTRSMS